MAQSARGMLHMDCVTPGRRVLWWAAIHGEKGI